MQIVTLYGIRSAADNGKSFVPYRDGNRLSIVVPLKDDP